MSSFTIRTDRKQKSNRRRVGGRGRRPRPTGQQGYSIGAFLKASQKVAPTKPRVDSDGFVMVTKRPRNHRQSPLSRRPKRNTKCVNAFAVLATSPTTKKTIAGPAIVKPKAVTGVWAKGPKRVSFANDSKTLMKPTPVETRHYHTDAATTAFVKYPTEEEYLKLKRSKGAWRPKSVPQVKEECQEDVYDARVKLNRAAYEVFNQEPVPSYIGSWADAVDSDSDDETDDFGRPTTDNSAW
jgi:hypothetical protein